MHTFARFSERSHVLKVARCGSIEADPEERKVLDEGTSSRSRPELKRGGLRLKQPLPALLTRPAQFGQSRASLSSTRAFSAKSDCNSCRTSRYRLRAVDA